MKRNMPGDISSGRFYLVFQPIVGAESRKIVSAEGLARWRDVENKIIAPAQFIPIAEESSLILSLSDRLLEEACGHIRQWRDDIDKRVVPISLNVSAIQLRDPGFGLSFIAKMAQFEIDPRSINVEITESTIIKNLAVATKSLDHLRKHGVGLLIDDFGTGYSSLSLLKDLPLDALKIDRRFIRGIGIEPRAKSIVQAIVELSKKLGFRTIAEGVETEEQAAILRDIGVNSLQGYYVSRPIEPVEFAGWLKGVHEQTPVA
jgi:EAL domain-containing protein (putative c-di-GMP-specific phosphodiesterase class I)